MTTSDRSPGPPPASAAAAIAAWLAGAERRLVEGLGLRPAPLPPDLARRTGRWKGGAATIRTRAWTGPAVRWARAAAVRGGPAGAPLAIVNLLCLPAADTALPILGADLVALGGRGREVLVCADCSPVAADAPLPPPADPTLPRLPAPAWCEGWLSPGALLLRADAALRPRALAAALAVVDGFVALAAGAPRRPADAAAALDAQRRYARRHREDDRGLGLLRAAFGDAWSDRYLRTVLLPEPGDEPGDGPLPPPD